jgi:hypothetical protein
MGLFDDDSQVHDTSFIWNGNEWGKSKTEGGREREREQGRVRSGVWQRKGCGIDHKLDCWSSKYT